MIRVELQGGLGNQLFIWAMAHRLTEEYKVHVKLIVPLNKHSRSDRPCELFELIDFCEHNISIEESRWFSTFTKVVDKICRYRIVEHLNIMNRLRIITQKYTDDILIGIKHPPAILRGYFQSKELPNSTKDEIHGEIVSYLEKLNFPDSVLMSKISSVVHIRRGDTKEIANEWGILSLDYYEKLMNNMDNLIICTDDIDFSDEILKRFPKSLVISPKESSAWQVLKIISHSEIFVMANSTLSWWGAWIAINHRIPTVYFPDPWRPMNNRASESLKIHSVILTPSIFELE
jgi:hypothetical protein